MVVSWIGEHEDIGENYIHLLKALAVQNDEAVAFLLMHPPNDATFGFCLPVDHDHELMVRRKNDETQNEMRVSATQNSTIHHRTRTAATKALH